MRSLVRGNQKPHKSSKVVCTKQNMDTINALYMVENSRSVTKSSKKKPMIITSKKARPLTIDPEFVLQLVEQKPEQSLRRMGNQLGVKVGIHGSTNWHVLANSIGVQMQTCSALQLHCMRRFRSPITSVSLSMLYPTNTIYSQLSINVCWVAFRGFFSKRISSTSKETKFHLYIRVEIFASK